MAPKPSRDMLIHCDECGEDYSSTYRRCPFCGARNEPRRNSGRDDPVSSSRYIPTPPPAKVPSQRDEQKESDDGYIFDGQDAFDEYEEAEEYDAPRPKGGKRLAPKQSGSFDLPPINWPRLITFLCSLVIIVAALVIVFTGIYPQLRGNTNNDPKDDPSSDVSDEPSQPPATVPTPGGQDSVDPTGGDSEPPATLPAAGPVATGITLNSYDFTLFVGESTQMTATVTPSDWSGEVIWTSSNPEWVTVSSTGYVTNVNATGSYHNAFITVTAGEVSARCEVRVRAVSADSLPSQPQPDPQVTQDPFNDPPASQAPTGGGPVVGRQGTIVGADSGLRVRGGPGTTYEILATLNNGNTVNVVEDAGNGWYKITFPGIGETITGYIMGEYISSN